jgi:hypothetical protein
VITDIVPNLLQATHRREVPYGIAEHLLALQSQPGSNSNHILFGYSDIDILMGESLGERFY